MLRSIVHGTIFPRVLVHTRDTCNSLFEHHIQAVHTGMLNQFIEDHHCITKTLH